MAFLHERKPSPVLHGDLKAANILLEDDGRRCVIADFGLAGWAHEQGSQAAKRGALTLAIAPPEVCSPCHKLHSSWQHLSAPCRPHYHVLGLVE
jgi:serine/threonine protein kinase